MIHGLSFLRKRYHSLTIQRKKPSSKIRSSAYRQVSERSETSVMWSSAVMLVVVTTCLFSVNGAALKKRFLDDLSQRELCNYMCSRDEWCPLSCPEHALLGLSFGKRDYRPFNDALGNLSFDDYLFLKMMGRTKK
ncbi:hypothetical protein LSH36_962g00001 [Paralvinella palmiformis]|uniref:Uncharacterized protein n=1 Tax=Paralvinella palmiformis TaxID=53620 RepID=A0AAD9MTG5_9ANNE|nr:hypothetical protein LSH36_962g00001 [Paralvinella palmiformis]